MFYITFKKFVLTNGSSLTKSARKSFAPRFLIGIIEFFFEFHHFGGLSRHFQFRFAMDVQAGRIELVLGPMFAGKTTEMLRRIERAELAHRRCAVFKYSKDTRYSQDKVATHDLKMRTAIPCCSLVPYMSICMPFDVVGVDEAQFFPDIVEFAEHLANSGKTVIVAGLDGDFRRKPFGRVLDLISKCESLTKLSAVCTETGGEACYTQRTIDSTDLEVIGGADIYRAACRTSFFHKPINGEVHLTIGPVRSGKTTELMRVLNRHYIAGRKPLLIRFDAAKASENEKLKYDVMYSNELPRFEELDEYHIIGVDEGQKFDDIGKWADELANAGKLVEISALDSNCEQEPYPNIIQLFPICEKVQKLDSICPITGLPAPFSGPGTGVNIPIPMSRLALLSIHHAMEQGISA